MTQPHDFAKIAEKCLDFLLFNLKKAYIDFLIPLLYGCVLQAIRECATAFLGTLKQFVQTLLTPVDLPARLTKFALV